jgi:hypothetical protein
MSYGWKHLNFNTAEPYLISQIIGDYLKIGDHETLKSIGLTQALINELEEGTPFYDPSRLYGLGEPFDSIRDLVTTGRINPARDLNIPGDLWKWQFLDYGSGRGDTLPEGIGNPQGRRTWVNERMQNASNQYVNESIANNSPFFQISAEERAAFKPRPLSNTFVHPSLTKFETAPSVNRLLSLFNAYGGDRSYILTALTGFSNRGLPGFAFYALDERVSGNPPPPELADYPIPHGMPFGQSRGDSFYYMWMMRNAYSGQYSGFEYDRMAAIWAEGRAPFSRYDINPSTGEWYGYDEVYHDWGLEDKIQVPAYYRKFRGGRRPDANHYEVRYSWDYCPTGITRVEDTTAGNYSSGEEFRYSIMRNLEDVRGVNIQLPSGLIVTETMVGDEHTPFLEWADVWDGQTFRPAKCPLTNYLVFGEKEPLIEFIKEVSEHVKAMNEWFGDGCPCDWQDYGGYVDPTVAAEAATAEAAAVSAATQYVPTSTTSATPPLNPKFGDLWRDSATGKTKTFVQTSATAGAWADS